MWGSLCGDGLHCRGCRSQCLGADCCARRKGTGEGGCQADASRRGFGRACGGEGRPAGRGVGGLF
eukprot:7284458-Lingulodinium_polyedra.AAC.1